MNKIDKKQAYLAMFAFLEEHWNRTKSDDLAVLLGSMSLLRDGETADPAIWNDWITAVKKAECGDVDAGLRLTKQK